VLNYETCFHYLLYLLIILLTSLLQFYYNFTKQYTIADLWVATPKK